MVLPGRVPRQRRQGRVRGRLQPCEETRGVVGGHGIGRARRAAGREDQGCGNGREFPLVKHL
jgi:hypothetical protein